MDGVLEIGLNGPGVLNFHLMECGQKSFEPSHPPIWMNPRPIIQFERLRPLGDVSITGCDGELVVRTVSAQTDELEARL